MVVLGMVGSRVGTATATVMGTGTIQRRRVHVRARAYILQACRGCSCSLPHFYVVLYIGGSPHNWMWIGIRTRPVAVAKISCLTPHIAIDLSLLLSSSLDLAYGISYGVTVRVLSCLDVLNLLSLLFLLIVLFYP